MGQYTTKGLYNKYDKNNKERSKTDYYATKPGETLNILEHLKIDFSNKTILEPCAGGGHMLQDILEYTKDMNNISITATDLHPHQKIIESLNINTGEEYDFLSDDYPIEKADWIIMNPPFATIEPFCIRALEIAQEGIVMFARLQFLEGVSRYENILKDNPPSGIWVYADRIQCWKEGIEPSGSSAQAYSWFVWDKTNDIKNQLNWIRRK